MAASPSQSMLHRRRVLLATLLVLVLAVTVVAGQAAPLAPDPAWLYSVARAATQKAGPPGPGVYIVVLAEPPLAAYAGGLPGLAATSPYARGTARLASDAPEAQAYLRHLEATQDAALRRFGAALGRTTPPRARFRYALNGMALVLSPAEAASIAALPGVRFVQRADLRQLASDVGPVRIGAAQPDLAPALFRASLAPARAGSSASGRAVLSYDARTRRLGLQLAFSGLSGPPTDASLRIAVAGQPEPFALSLASLAAPGGGLYAGELTLSDTPALPVAALERALLAGEATLAIATAADPAGEVRGPLLPVRGAGSVAGVIDGGINPFQPSFAERGADGFVQRNPRGRFFGVCDPGDRSYDPAFPCNAKLIGAYRFPAATAPDPAGRPSPFDDNGHGSHVAGTLAGHLLAESHVARIATGAIAGVAPHAALIVYDACGTPAGGVCPMEATLAAIDQAVADGVEVINFSISGFATDPWEDAEALALLGAYEAGILTAVAAGNGGPVPASIGAPANAPWVLALGAASHGRRFVRTLSPLSGGAQPPPPPLVGAGFGAEALPASPLVDAARLPDTRGAPNSGCLPFAAEVRLQGAILVCRQLIDPASAARHAAAAGAGGLVLIWPATAGALLPTEPLALPAIQLDAAAGEQLLGWLAAGTGHQAALSAASRDPDGPADVVAWFSARGPNRTTPGVLKPDLVAPGLAVLAASADVEPEAPDYALLSGTSMAAPHAAGAIALLRELQPDWSPAELRSALMTTAAPAFASDGTAASAHSAGAGRIDLGLAARAGLLLDETPARFRAADPRRGGDPTGLNLPGLSSPACLERCVFTRTLRSALAAPATWEASTSGDPALNLLVEPARFTLAPGATQTVTITAQLARDVFSASGSYRFGTVGFIETSSLAPRATLTAALNAVSSILPAEVQVRTHEPGGAISIPALRTISAPALTLRVLGLKRGELRRLQIAEDPTPTDLFDGPPGTAHLPITVPPGASRVYLGVQATTAPDIDLFVFADGAGGPPDGVPQLAELICTSAGFTSDEVCDLRPPDVQGQTLIALVQNYRGSGLGADRVDLLVNVVTSELAGNGSASGPAMVPAGEPFAVTLQWRLPDQPAAAGRYLGVLQLSSSPDPAIAGDLGSIPIDLDYLRERTFVPVVSRP